MYTDTKPRHRYMVDLRCKRIDTRRNFKQIRSKRCCERKCMYNVNIYVVKYLFRKRNKNLNVAGLERMPLGNRPGRIRE